MIKNKTSRRLLIQPAATAAAAALLLPALASAATYTDTEGDKWSPNAYIDLTSAQITNDATNLTIVLHVGTGANLLDVNQQYGNYELGFHIGAGGQTQINSDYSGSVASGNPYGTPVGISS